MSNLTHIPPYDYGDKKEERRDAYEDDTTRDNDHGKVISHKNMFDENGVQPVDDDDV